MDLGLKLGLGWIWEGFQTKHEGFSIDLDIFQDFDFLRFVCILQAIL